MIIINQKLVLTTFCLISIAMNFMTKSSASDRNYIHNNPLQSEYNQLPQNMEQQTNIVHNKQVKKHRSKKSSKKDNNNHNLQTNKHIFIHKRNELAMYKQFDISKLKSTNMCEEVMSGFWQLNNNCITDTNVNMDNSIFEITNGVCFETQYNSMAHINLNASTFWINSGKYVHQSNNFNKLDNETKVVLYPNSRIIWNSQNYRLFDATGNTLFIVYPDSMIDGASINSKITPHYIIDGNNKTSTIYLNRIKLDSSNHFIPNVNIQGTLCDINVVLPLSDSNNQYNLVLDKSMQLSKCALYPNLYFKNCTILNEDYTRTVDVQTITDWIIKGHYQKQKNNSKAILSSRDIISSDQISNNNDKFSVYDVELGYANKNSVLDARATFSSLFNGESKSEYNIPNVVIYDEQYPCYFDLSLLSECFNMEDNSLDILNNIPNILNVGLIGNRNIKLVNCNLNGERDNYDEVQLLGNNMEYYGIIFASNKTKKITFGENSYTRVDILFNKQAQQVEQSNSINTNTNTKKRYIIGQTQTNQNTRQNLSNVGVILNENGIKCDVIFDGSNKVFVEGQSIINLNITKNAQSVKLIPYESTKTVFDMEGVLNLEEYVENQDDENDSGIFVIEDGVELKA